MYDFRFLIVPKVDASMLCFLAFKIIFCVFFYEIVNDSLWLLDYNHENIIAQLTAVF